MTITTIKNAVVPQNVPQNASQQTDIEKIMRLIKENPGATREQLAQAIGKSTKSVQRLIHDCGCIEHVGSSKTGHWVIKEE